MLARSYALLASALLLDFHLGESLRLKPNLIFHFIFLLYPEEILALPLFVLLLDHLGLLGFLLLLQQQRILHFLLLFVPLLGDHVVVL